MKIESDLPHPLAHPDPSVEPTPGWERVWAETRGRSKPDPRAQGLEMEHRVLSTIHAARQSTASSLGVRSVPQSKLRPIYQFGAATIAAFAMVLAIVVGSHLSRTMGRPNLVTIVSQLGAASPHLFQLPDGSNVTIAPGTRVEFAANARYVRNVKVEGEAFFDVQYHSDEPFQVEAGQSIIRVLGTSFNVRRFASDGQTTVAVLSGKVQMDHAILSRGEIRTVYSDGRSEYQHDQDITRLVSWKTGKMHFTGTPLGIVVQDIGRWYGVEFIVNNERIAAIPLTLTVSNERLETLLFSIEQTAGVSLARHGNQVTITSSQLND